MIRKESLVLSAAMSAAIAATPAAAAGPVPPPAHADMESCAHLAVPPPGPSPSRRGLS